MILANSKLTSYEIGNEQRKTPRVAADFAVEIETAGGSSRGWAVDIGLGGMFIETDQAPSYASSVVVTIADPLTPHPIRVPAVVRWTTARGFGVQFGLLGVRETFALLALTSGLSRFEEEAVTMTMRRTLCC
jgi:type IV pilus assembly protein PilZ